MDLRSEVYGKVIGRPRGPHFSQTLRTHPGRNRGSGVSPACCSDERPRAPKGFGKPKYSKKLGDDVPSSSAEALTRSLGEVSKRQGRVSKTTNVILGADNTEDTWRQIDKKVNEYPSQRYFTAIGIGGVDFSQSMVKVVESVVGPVHMECITETASSNGKYLSVKVGPVWVQSAEEVVAVYSAMREDDRLKWSM